MFLSTRTGSGCSGSRSLSAGMLRPVSPRNAAPGPVNDSLGVALYCSLIMNVIAVAISIARVSGSSAACTIFMIFLQISSDSFVGVAGVGQWMSVPLGVGCTSSL